MIIYQPALFHSIHGTGIFTYIYHKNQPNVGKYIILLWVSEDVVEIPLLNHLFLSMSLEVLKSLAQNSILSPMDTENSEVESLQGGPPHQL